MDEYDKISQRVGEFVVSFQWLENRLREIGWLILDPHRTEWPPTSLRDETNYKLLNKVESLFTALIEDLDINDVGKRKTDFSTLIAACHELRRYRNDLLHSTYMELKSGGDIVGLMRSNPRLKYDSESGEPQYDQEELRDSSILEKMKELAELSFAVNMHYMQVNHWAPFDHKRKRA